MRKLVSFVLSCALCACVVSTPPGPPPFEERWWFLDGSTAKLGDDVVPPIATRRMNAVYPEEARKQRLTGEVGFELTLDDAGQVVDIKLVQPLEPTMDEAALHAIRQWKFDPARLNGVPKACIVRKAMKFALFSA